MKKVAIYGGSFNPIHIGHLALANYICEWGWADEVWFLVSPQNPLKKNDELLSDKNRLQLVKEAIEEYSRFKVSDIEFHLSKPSYTIHTLKALKAQHPDLIFSLLIGADNWKIIDRWKEYKRIIEENEILIYPRAECPIEHSDLPENIHLIPAPILEISSTEIRQAFKKGKKPIYFLHSKVYKLIRERGWYQE